MSPTAGKLSAAFSSQNPFKQSGIFTYMVIVLWDFVFLYTSFRVISKYIISNNNNNILLCRIQVEHT